MELGELDKILYITLVMYVLLMGSLFVSKPDFMYDKKNGKFRHFGTHKEETILSMATVGISSSILIYLFVTIYIFLLSKLK